jgi:hypothetical protein
MELGTLGWALRDQLGLTGTKLNCDRRKCRTRRLIRYFALAAALAGVPLFAQTGTATGVVIARAAVLK